MSNKNEALLRRKARVRRALRAAANGRPRLSVFRSSKQIYVQVIDDAAGRTLAAASSLDKDLKSSLKTGADKAAAEAVGKGGALTFAMLLNLAAVANTEDPAVLWGFIRRYDPDVGPETHPVLARLVGHALAYFRDLVRPAKTYRAATDAERAALEDLAQTLAAHEGPVDPEGLQAVVYEVGRRHFPDLSGKAKSPDGRPGVSQAWFTTIYNVLFGEARGPRFGSFIALYGVAETRALIAQALAGAFLPDAPAP